MEIVFTDMETADQDVWHVPLEFGQVMQWLVAERDGHQLKKWGDGESYVDEDVVHVKEGLTEDSWFWVKGIENYAGRVRTFQRAMSEDWHQNPLAIQALLKLAATIVCMPEHLLRSDTIQSLPRPGVPSGEL